MNKPERPKGNIFIGTDPNTMKELGRREMYEEWQAFYEQEKAKLPDEEEIRDELLRIKTELSQQSPTYADIAHAMKQAKAIHDRIRGNHEELDRVLNNNAGRKKG